MRKLPFVALVFTGCLCTESRQIAAECIDKRAIATQEALQEVARLSIATPLPPAVVEPLKRAHVSVSGIRRWTDLQRQDFGAHPNPPETETSNEVIAQALYKQRIDMMKAIKESIPINPISNGPGLPWGQAGGGLLSVILGAFGLRKAKQLAKVQKGMKAALNVIGSHSEAKVEAAKDPDIIRAYGEKKLTEYEMKAKKLES